MASLCLKTKIAINYNTPRRVAKIWKGGGGFFLKIEKTANDLDLNLNHTVCSKIKTEFFGKLGNSNVFSAQKQVISKKKVFTEIETDFSAKIGYPNAFSVGIPTCTSQLRHPISFGRGCFYFITKNRPQKHQKRAILHTSQANGGARAPPPHLASLLNTPTQIYFWSKH